MAFRSTTACKKGPLPLGVLVPWFLLLILFLGNIQICFSVANNMNGDDDVRHRDLNREVVAERCIESERRALLDIEKDMYDHGVWLSSWRKGGDCCSWRGVECDNTTGHVIKLDLRCPYFYDVYDDPDYIFRQRPSKLNPSLFRLVHLNYLDLSLNKFGGAPIPTLIGSLVSLEYLNLSYSSLSGTIPHQLGNLSNLQFLDLRFNYPYFEPTLNVRNLQWLSKMIKLQYLDLSWVNLSKVDQGWIREISMLPALSVLKLRGCDLSSIPTTLQHVNNNFTSLTVIDLSFNSFPTTMIPSWILNITTLVQLDLSSNNFHDKLPLPTWHFRNLQALNLAENKFGGEILHMLGSLSHLEYLHLSFNILNVSIPNNLWNLSSHLKHLYLRKNNIWGEIPKTFGDYSRLEYLSIGGNSLSGMIPNNIGDLHNLNELDLSGNKISGSIPSNIGNLHNLNGLYLYENQISGSIPSTIGNLHNLNELYLFENQISGSIPSSIWNLHNLKELVLQENKISGSIPSTIGNLHNLNLLSLSRNKISGHIPTNVKNLVNLNSLDLSNNLINGVIPEYSLCNMSLLKELYLSNNSISGYIPKAFEKFYNLEYLDLSNNRINGQIPNINSSKLQYIDLSNNSLSGSIPLSFGSSLDINVFVLSQNHLSGTFPLFICNLTSLDFLDLSDNNLYGGIPLCQSKSSWLWFFDLSSNSLSGQIPNSFGSYNQLQALHLNKNNLSGTIPSSLKNCTQLVTLDLSENIFSGTIPKWIGKSFSLLRVLNLRSNSFNGNIPMALSSLSCLQVLDLSNNNLVGKLCLHFEKFSAMKKTQYAGQSMFNRTNYLRGDVSSGEYFGTDVWQNVWLITKGVVVDYTSVLSAVTTIDLSRNNLSGEISTGLVQLHRLCFLNLSQNHLTGNIPVNIGAMKQLQSLDLSVNNISGEIPSSMSALNFLEHLNLSNNKLSGKIPSGGQLSSFDDPSAYINNLDLCGWPLPQCPTSKPSDDTNHTNNQAERSGTVWIYASAALGYVVSFWAFIGAIMIKQSIRHAYFHRVDMLYDWMYVKYAISMVRLKSYFSKEQS